MSNDTLREIVRELAESRPWHIRRDAALGTRLLCAHCLNSKPVPAAETALPFEGHEPDCPWLRARAVLRGEPAADVDSVLKARLLSLGFRSYLEGVILDCDVTAGQSERAAEVVQEEIRRLIGSESAAQPSEECRGCAELRAETERLTKEVAEVRGWYEEEIRLGRGMADDAAKYARERDDWQKTAHHCNQRKDEMKAARVLV